MPTFIVTARIEFPSKQQAIQTGQIRMEIPADSVSEAHIKARAFITSKLKVVIDSCENKERKAFADSILGGLDGFPQDFKDIFKNL